MAPFQPYPEGLARAKAAAQRDLRAPREEGLLPWPKTLKAWCINHVLHDPRDLPLLQLLFNVALIPLPTAMLLFALPPSHVLGCIWFCLCYACFLQRFLLALHYSEHRNIFSTGSTMCGALYFVFSTMLLCTILLISDTAWQPLNHLAQYILAPLYGVPPGIYRLHHCIMHHVVCLRMLATVFIADCSLCVWQPPTLNCTPHRIHSTQYTPHNRRTMHTRQTYPLQNHTNVTTGFISLHMQLGVLFCVHQWALQTHVHHACCAAYHALYPYSTPPMCILHVLPSTLTGLWGAYGWAYPGTLCVLGVWRSHSSAWQLNWCMCC